LLGTTREFLDYFSLKRLDDLPTLAQLKELEDLRVQLSLPGADPQVAVARDAGAESEPDTLDARAEDDDEHDSASAEDPAGESPRPHGLVASGAEDDPN
jgi:segregation and condensation protein B